MVDEIRARILCVHSYVEGRAPRLSQRLFAAMVAEFRRNGGQCLTAGKVRYLRRRIARTRARIAGA